MPHNLTFNGVRKNWLILRQGRQKAPFAPLRRNLLVVPGMPGAYLQSTDVEPIVINQPIGFKVDDDEHALQLKDELATWLITDKPVPLQFDDEPGRTYYAVVQNTLDDFEKFAELRQGTIQFLCLDPYAYGEEITADFPSDSVIVENPGTAEADPIFELTAKKQTTFAMVSNGEQYMAIGRPDSVEDIPMNDRETILNDDASSLVGWSAYTGGSTLYNLGIVGGQMGVYNGFAFYAEEYGENPNGWVGPAIRRSLSEQLQDFMITIDIEMRNLGGGVGRIVLFGMDANDNLIFTMGMMDSTASYANNRALFGLGPNNKTWINYQGDNNRVVWNDARLQLRIQRKGQVYEGWIAEKLDPEGTRLTGRHWESYHDTANEFQQPLAQIGIYIAKAKHYDVFPMRFHGLTAWKLINLEDYQIPYIAEEGDLIIFNHENKEALVNGYPVPFDFGADFFKLYRGNNSLVVLPENKFDTTLRFRPRYR